MMGARAATLAQIVPRAETSENHSSSGEMIMPIDQNLGTDKDSAKAERCGNKRTSGEGLRSRARRRAFAHRAELMLARIDSRRNRVRRVADIKSSPSFTRMIGKWQEAATLSPFFRR
jgi:hypothetical protein